VQFVKPIPFHEAIEKLGERSPIASRLKSSEWAEVPTALRERAFFSSRVESMRFLQRGRDAISDFLQQTREVLPNGESALATGGRAKFIEGMRQFAAKEGMGPLDRKGALTDITSERRLGLIFDTQTQQMQDFGYRKQGMDPDVLNEFPAQRFIRVKDVSEPRDWHVQFEDQVYLKTDPIWKRVNRDFGVPWGPWGWGCGHDVEDVDRDEAEALGLIRRDQVIEPPRDDPNEGLEASTKGMDPDLIEKLQQEFGDRIKVEGDAIAWNAEAVGREQALGMGPLRPHPFTEALDLRVYGAHKEQVLTGLGAIERVHDTPQLPKVPLRDTKQRVYGYLKPAKTAAGGMKTDHMAVRSDGPWPALTAVHESGHFLDLEAIGAGNLATRQAHPDMLRVLAAADNTQAVQGLKQRFASATSRKTKGHYAYLLSPEEIWARAYAQFVTERSGTPSLQRDLAAILKSEKFRQWDAADFAPVAREIENLFKTKGWL
jgi:hypothetical protein